jgi:uncharacterized protein
MKRINLGFVIVILVLSSCVKSEINIEKQEPVPFTAVHINDQFWAPKIETNRTVSIPSAFHQCEINGRMDNFALAGGLIKGEHKGDFPFDDTDVYKIVEGASYALAVEYDPKLDAYVDSVINLIAVGQEDDGYLFTCVTNKSERLRPWYGKGRWDRLNSHELYNCGHLYEAAVAHYQATGKRTLLDVAIKNANLIDQVFGPAEGQMKVPSGHPIIEMALVKLWRATGEERYLKLAKFFIDETGVSREDRKLNAYSQDHMPIVDQQEAVGHAVRLGYLYAGVTDVASLLSDSALMAASKNVWDNVVSKKLYITGGIGSRSQGEGFGDNYELNNMTAYCETCASISNVYWNYRLFLNQPSSAFYDVLERTLYNGVISGVSLSGDKFFYDNPLESDNTHDRAPWFGCACCPGNVTRFMASIPGYVYTTDSKNIMVNLFVGSNSHIPFHGDTLALVQKTSYPWEGGVTIEIENEIATPYNLLVRLPGWANNEAIPSDLYKFTQVSQAQITFKVNGKTVKPQVIDGYAAFARKWKKGDKIEVEMPMEIHKIAAHELVAANTGKLSYQRGPVVYCFEDKDNPNAWLFDTYIEPSAATSSSFEKELLGGVETIEVEGVVVKDDQSTEPVALKAIPYYAWNNRGTANMAVWMATAPEFVYSKKNQLKEKLANPTASEGWAPGLNDGFDPKSSTDIDKHFFSWWHKDRTDNWVQYNFEELQTLTESQVYWLNTNHYEGDYRAPKAWVMQYKNAQGKWMNVEATNEYETAYDRFNVLQFKEIKTKAVRLNVEFQPDFTAGIVEWRVN